MSTQYLFADHQHPSEFIEHDGMYIPRAIFESDPATYNLVPHVTPDGPAPLGYTDWVLADGVYSRELAGTEEERAAAIAEQQLSADLATLAALRYEKEISGTIWNGWPVVTDTGSQAKVTAACVMAIAGLWPDGAVWKFGDLVARPMTSVQIQQMAGAVIAHVQACFEREADIAESLRAGAPVDMNTGWPGQ